MNICHVLRRLVCEVLWTVFYSEIYPQFRYDVALLRLSTQANLNSYVQLGSLPPSGQLLPHNNLCYITGWGRTSSESIAPPPSDPQLFFQWRKIFRFLYLLFLAGGSLSAQLKQAYLPLVDHANCSRSDWWGSTVKNTMVCAGGSAESGCNVSHLLHEEKEKKVAHNIFIFLALGYIFVITVFLILKILSFISSQGDSGGPLNCLVNGKYYVHGVTSFVSGWGCNYPKKPTVFTRVSAYMEWMDSVSINAHLK